MSAVAAPSPPGEALVRVSTRELVRLAGPARALPLRPRRARARLSGGFLSPLRGRGMEFDEVRPYQPGDDIRSLEWRVTARTGRAHTKLFREERERPVLVLVDLCAAMFFATRGRFKAVQAARAAGLLAWSAEIQGDRVGGLVFDEHCHREIEPRRGQAAVMHYLGELAGHPAWSRQAAAATDPQPLRSALRRLQRVARAGSLIVLASDFRLLDAECESVLRMLAAASDVMLLMVYDSFERELPQSGFYRLTDGEFERRIDAGSAAVRERHRREFAEREERVRSLARSRAMSFVPCRTDEDALVTLQKGLGLR